MTHLQHFGLPAPRSLALLAALLLCPLCAGRASASSGGTSELSASSKSSDDSSSSTSDSSKEEDKEKKRLIVPMQTQNEAARWLSAGAHGPMSTLLSATLRAYRQRLAGDPTARGLSDAQLAARLLREKDAPPSPPARPSRQAPSR